MEVGRTVKYELGRGGSLGGIQQHARLGRCRQVQQRRAAVLLEVPRLVRRKGVVPKDGGQLRCDDLLHHLR